MKIFLDTDLNFPSDDFQALMLFLANEQIEIVGIGATAGNTWSEEVHHNLHRAFALLNLHEEAPRVFRGPPAGDFAHDRDRILGDASIGFTGAHGKASAPRAWIGDGQRSPVDDWPDAVQAIIDASHRDPGELVVVCLGPLTNLARALERDPSLTHRIRDVAVMGGCFSDESSARASIDFNVLFDPASAETVLESGLAVRLFPLDLCRRARCTPELIERLARHDGGWADVFLDDFLASTRQHGVSMALTDQLVALVCGQDDLVLAEERCRVAVGSACTADRGLTTGIPDPASRVTVVRQVDVGRVHDRLVALVDAMRRRGRRPVAVFSTPAYTYMSGLRLAAGPFSVVDAIDGPDGYGLGIRDVLTADELSRAAGECAGLAAAPDEDRLSRKHAEHAVFDAVTSARAAIVVRSAEGAPRAVDCLSLASNSRRDRLQAMLGGVLPENAAVAELRNGLGLGNDATFDRLDPRLHAWYRRSMRDDRDIAPLFLISWDRETATIYELTTRGYAFVARRTLHDETGTP